MSISPLALHAASAAELRDRLAAERRGSPFLVFRDAAGVQQIFELGRELLRATLGRGDQCDIRLDRDNQISRVHAELQRLAEAWFLVDDGLSTNGSFVNGHRIAGRCRLRDGDVVGIGDTLLAFRHPALSSDGTTRVSDHVATPVSLTEAQRRVLIALCRPLKGGTRTVPATNPEIAAELFLSLSAVKSHMRGLFAAFKIDGLAQQEKRQRVAALAFASGLVSDRDLDAP